MSDYLDYLITEKISKPFFEFLDITFVVIVSTVLTALVRLFGDIFFPFFFVVIFTCMLCFVTILAFFLQICLGIDYINYKRKEEKQTKERKALEFREGIINETLERMRQEIRIKEDPESSNRFYDIYKESKVNLQVLSRDDEIVSHPVISNIACKTCGHYIANCICREEN